MIFEKIYEIQNLKEAWKSIRSKRPAPGIDRIKVNDFQKKLDENLHNLSREIQAEKYRPMPVMVYKDRKNSDKYRLIGISTIRDRVVQQAILNVAAPYFESRFLPCSYAYRPKRSAIKAVNQAGKCIKEGCLWFLKMDIKKFFDNIDHDLLIGFIRQVIDEDPAIRLISRFLKTKIFKEMGLFDNTVGSQQGSGLSPLLSNIYLHPLDLKMWSEFKTRYIRYSDDIAVFAEIREGLEKAQSIIKNGLNDLKLSDSPEKTMISHVSSGIVYLGFYLDIKGKGPGRKSIDQIHEKLKNLPPIRKTDNIDERIKTVDQQLRGWYSYYKNLAAITPPNVLSLLSLVRLACEANEIRYARDLIRQHEVFRHNHPDISFHIAELFFELGMHDHAMREYAKALELDPTMTRAKQRINSVQSREEDLNKAVEKMKTVLHHNPHYREGYEKLAEYYVRLGMYGFAEKAAQKAIEIDDEIETNRPLEEIARKSRQHIGSLEFEKSDQKLLLDVFKGRNDAHGRQWVDERGKSGYIRVERKIKTTDIYKHLKGEETLAVYPVTIRDTVNFIVFDIDISKRIILRSTENAFSDFIDKTHKDILRIKKTCELMGIPLYIEDSGYKGRHGWIFFDQDIPATKAIHIGNDIIKRSGEPTEGLVWELFPKGKSERDRNLIKIPLGVNKISNRRCLFIDNAGKPIPEQMKLLSNIHKFDIRRFDIIEMQARQNGAVEKADGDGQKIQAPRGVKEMINGCEILKHLVNKARDTNYLNHYERICLLYTLTFAGDEGIKYLHTVMGYCLNYDFYHTQRHIDRRRESPISCARIMEYFFELAETMCKCKFKLPPHSYPSPVLYMLEAEINSVSNQRIFPDKKPEKSSEQDENTSENQNRDISKPSVLNFDKIFSDEQKNNSGSLTDISETIQSNDTDQLPRYDRKPEKTIQNDSSGNNPVQDDTPVHSSIITPTGISLTETRYQPENLPDLSQYRGLESEKQPMVSDEWDLFFEYIHLKREQMKFETRLESISKRLEQIFDKLDSGMLITEKGTIQRIISQDGTIKWSLNININDKS